MVRSHIPPRAKRTDLSRRRSSSPVRSASPSSSSSNPATVLTESWSSRYKSSIIESKVKRTLRRAGHKAHEPGSNQAARQLLALEGFDEEEDIDPKDLPGKLVATLKSFHEHARFFMVRFQFLQGGTRADGVGSQHGRTGDTPPALRKLIDAADEFDDELEQLRVNGDLEETAAHGETRHVRCEASLVPFAS